MSARGKSRVNGCGALDLGYADMKGLGLTMTLLSMPYSSQSIVYVDMSSARSLSRRRFVRGPDGPSMSDGCAVHLLVAKD